jgi:hypothetical protein
VGTVNNGAAGDTVNFSGLSRTILVRNFPAPGAMLIQAPTVMVPIQDPNYAVGFSPNGGGIIGCAAGITVSANFSLLTKRNYITGAVYVGNVAVFTTTYRQAIYHSSALTIEGATFTPTDDTSPNGVVFALETGNLLLYQNSILTF